jgi:tetratricopeptide (TPR) repeat protein
MLLCILVASQAFSNEVVLKKGRALQRQQKYAEAARLYEKAIKQKPSADLYVEFGSLLGKLQKYDQAKELLEDGLKKFPENGSVKNLLALILIRTDNKDKALDLLNEVLIQNPKNGFALNWKRKLIAEMNNSQSNNLNSSQTSTGDSAQKRLTSRASDGDYQIDNSASEEEQTKLAIELYKEMMTLEKWEIDAFKDLHRRVIEKCPDTGQAEESCWRLSNLYLLGEDPPDYHSIIEVLEHMLKQYPDSPLLPDAKNRLLMSYQQTEQLEKVVEIYQELFTLDPDPIDDKVFMVRALEFADALAAIGQSGDAQAWYMKIIEKDDGRDMLEARVARERLAGED